MNKSKYRTFLLPFGLAFSLTGLAAWLFIPWLLTEAPPGVRAASPTQAVGNIFGKAMPEHVFFSPRAHSLDGCNQCHTFSQAEYLNIFGLQEQPDTQNGSLFYQAVPMNMDDCMRCHAIAAHKAGSSAGEACGSCHR